MESWFTCSRQERQQRLRHWGHRQSTLFTIFNSGIMQTRKSGFVCTFCQVYRAYFKPSPHSEMVITHSKPVPMQKITCVCASRLQGDGYSTFCCPEFQWQLEGEDLALALALRHLSHSWSDGCRSSAGQQRLCWSRPLLSTGGWMMTAE